MWVPHKLHGARNPALELLVMFKKVCNGTHFTLRAKRQAVIFERVHFLFRAGYNSRLTHLPVKAPFVHMHMQSAPSPGYG